MPYRMLEDFADKDDWTVLSDSTTTLADSTASLTGSNCLSVAKASAGEAYAGVYKTDGVALDLKDAKLSDHIMWACQCSSLTNVAYAFVRLGTDASNYAEWRYADSSLVAARWTLCSEKLGNQFVTGTGIDWDNIEYLAIGVQFDAAGNALAAILLDTVMFHKAILTA